MTPIISVRNIGKKYDINHTSVGYTTLREVIMNIVRSPFRFLKGKAEAVIGINQKEEFWALKNVSFDVQKGEIIGIIGPNGAGKSTLLKILSQITPPAEGEIILRGRVGSLLEVGTGFHPELSGRENIFLNGAILGMTKKEIVQKFDAIVEFAGIEKFLDTPVKYYSSGMYVRLAFSVAAHMEPDILIVDEVLAVGDAEFQKKCLGKMEEVTKQDGRTILFVSHNLDAIQRLCTKTILLKKGEIVKFGETAEVINYYLNTDKALNAVVEYPVKENLDGQIKKVSILDQHKLPSARISVAEKFFIEVEFEVRKKLEQKAIFLYFFYQGELLLLSTEIDKIGEYKTYEPGTYTVTAEIPSFLLQIGVLFVNVGLKHLRDGRGSVDTVKDVSFEITNENNPRHPIWGDDYAGKISTMLDYRTEKL